MSSLARMMVVLDLFTPQRNRITADVVIDRLGYSRTTAYRYLQVLAEAGLIARFSGGYTLGPRAIEMDFLIRGSDPLLAASEPIMAEIGARHACDVQLLVMAGGRVLVSGHRRSARSEATFGRGRTTPTFRGSGAKVIAAMLPRARQRRLFERHPAEAAAAGLGNDWASVARTLAAIRRAGAYVSHGELDPGNVGIAVPIVHAGLDHPAALVAVLQRAAFMPGDEDAMLATLQRGAAEILHALDVRTRDDTGPDSPSSASVAVAGLGVHSGRVTGKPMLKPPAPKPVAT